ncbi:MAG: Predicted L-lactate dehydrogenase, Iron-sulfur cluster-binding subunit YkgF [uncultured Propionibacteriaceae bacterium]|uniref:Predicted L-lactate dehydrogenase, Iron-sulfur cluster-binding subunit YkgF n=1 Tax=uncultured Propionibacteriaceae bacterium TaxID=257457 RepID=A0A6J4PPR7_9ACTN|nr:MAG: Predicted L-lactate dehydrogenase, Iron-sulfur cluster-binding subunit YkgF [uncultured Propionibacteriaceae bacterium]
MTDVKHGMTGVVGRPDAPTRRHGGSINGLRPQPGAAFLGMPVFPDAAKIALGDEQLRRNLGHATATIRTKRLKAVEEMPDWQDMRLAAAAIKDNTLARLDTYLEQFEAAATQAGAVVHWAVDADDACRIGIEIAQQHQAKDVIKVKSMATQEIELNEALEAVGINAWETDLAELIVQLGGDTPSHFLVPAIHRNRSEIRDIFLSRMGDVGRAAPADLTNEPRRLAEAARLHLREKFMATKVAFSGANFAIADTGTLSVVESEGNGRMCLTLPDVLVSVVGIEKLLPTFTDLEVFLQVLPRSSTAERMNPYTTMWTGVSPGDGPQEVHIILVDNGRTRALADEVGRQALRCIRCSACLNVCPVYERVGGHAYGSVYPGPIGAILNPLLHGVTDPHDAALPFASSLCGACYEACPVAIDIPTVLIEQRAAAVHEKGKHAIPTAESLAMKAAAWTFGDAKRLARAQRAAGLGRGVAKRVSWLPGMLGGWTDSRTMPPVPKQSFRRWWSQTRPPGKDDR